MTDTFITFAHRGATSNNPENSLPAFKEAIDRGFKWIEFDVQLVEDTIVVFHDRRLERLTGEEGILVYKSLDFLKKLKVNKKEKIPTLDEVLGYIQGRCKVNIEIKSAGCSSGVFNLINHAIQFYSFKADDFLVSSFDTRELIAFKELCIKNTKDYKIGFLYYGNPTKSILFEIKNLLNPYSLNIDIDNLDQDIIKYAKDLGIKVYVYTIINDKESDHLKSIGVDGVFRDV